MWHRWEKTLGVSGRRESKTKLFFTFTGNHWVDKTTTQIYKTIVLAGYIIILTVFHKQFHTWINYFMLESRGAQKRKMFYGVDRATLL